jgi:cold shock CspA family protein
MAGTHTGRLVRWFDAKGYGFLAAPGLAHDIFLHVSALRAANLGEPTVGAEFNFDISDKGDGKLFAKNITATNGAKPTAFSSLVEKIR